MNNYSSVVVLQLLSIIVIIIVTTTIIIAHCDNNNNENDVEGKSDTTPRPHPLPFTRKRHENAIRYTNKWYMKFAHNNPDNSTLQSITEETGLEFNQVFPEIGHVYELHHSNHPRNSKYENHQLRLKLKDNPQIIWAQQEFTVARKLRKDVTCPRDGSSNYLNAFNDPYWKKQWYSHDCRKSAADGPIYDLNVVPVYDLLGYTGKGIVVVIVDDGVEIGHQDLKENYDSRFGLDLVNKKKKTPEPVHTWTHTASHGTRCAGTIAMSANNKLCGVGIAPSVTFGAIRLIGSKTSSDNNDSQALSFKIDQVDVVSNSWGPDDNGKLMEKLEEMTRGAIKDGIKEGRGGLGSIYIFACGNGKKDGDYCSCDGYVSSIYTIAVASSDQDGKETHYSERCPSIMVTSYSGGGVNNHNVVATDVKGKCTDSHTGTSASAPIIAGVICLALEANKNLSWRDVQHIFTYTSEVYPLQNNSGWSKNQAGFWFSHDFGFGMVNAFNYVLMARDFKSVPPMRTCVITPDFQKKYELGRKETLGLSFYVNGCENTIAEVNYLEHVQLRVDLEYSRRGDLEITLFSPAGTKSKLLDARPKDSSKMGIDNWYFDTIACWGESPKGTWIVEFSDTRGWSSNKGKLNSFSLVTYGTNIAPEHYSKPRSYYKFSLGQSKKNKR